MTTRYLSLGLAALALAAAPRAQVVFDTFDDGTVTDVSVFSGSNAGIGVGTTDGRTGVANTALSVGINPAQAGGFAGFVVPGGAGTTDVSAQRSLTFYIRPTTVQASNLPLTLEVNLHEDTNGNGAYDGATEDEFQANYTVTTGTGYTRVQIPLSSFVDDNSVFPGNGGFDFSKLFEVVFAIGGPSGPEFAFAIDDIVFTTDGPPPPGPTIEFDYFTAGFDASRAFVFSANNGGGIGIGPIDDAAGTPNRAVNVGIDPSGTGAFAGVVFTGGAGVTDASRAVNLTFQIRPIVQASNLPLTLEVNLHEDTNGNGVYDGATEDEYQALYTVTGPSGYITVTLPISSFTDDNSAFPGANNGFDFSKLLEIVIVVAGPRGPGYALSFDQIGLQLAAVAGEASPEAAALALRAVPNPAAGAARATFTLPAPADVRLTVLDALGRTVATADAGAQPAGPGSVALPTADLPAGVYVVRLTAGSAAATARWTVVR